MRRARPATLSAVIVAAAGAALLAPAPAGAQTRGAAASPSAAKPFFDARDDQRRAVERRGDVSLRTPSAVTRSARARLRAGGAVVEVDPLAGTPRLLAGRGAALSAPARGGDRREAAERYLRRQLPAFGLSRTDLGSLQLEQRRAIPGGAELLGYQQYAGAIPSFDGGLSIAVDAAGRVVSVTGAAQPGLSLNTTAPALSAEQAMRALMADAGVRRPVRVVSGPSGPRRTTAFAGGETAALVAFAEGTSARLGWQLDLRAGPGAHYAAVVDAVSGQILYRANRVKAAANDALVWEQYPGAPRGGASQTRDLTPYLTPGASDLSGP